MLEELSRVSTAKKLVDRAEAGHLDLPLRSKSALQLIKWRNEAMYEYENNNSAEKGSAAEKLRAENYERRLYEVCDREKEWFFSIDAELRQRITAILLCSTCPFSIYYKKALLPQ